MQKQVIAYVDGSYRDNQYSYGVLLIDDNDRYHLCGRGDNPDFLTMRNVSGEIIAAMVSVKKALELNASAITIYYDYKGIGAWADGEWKTNKEGTAYYKQFIANCRKNIDITFVKVKAHSGIKGNEIADVLAEKGHNIKGAS